MEKLKIPRIPDFYVGQKILITGATGYLGRVLVEKLLRSCPGLEMIYVIVRSKKGQSPEERWKERTNCILFDRLRKERPGALEKKVKVLEGDASELRLGLSPDDYDLLQDQVTIIFHAAASVRFNDPFTFSVFINVRSTRELVQLALGAKHLKQFVHISTAFSNCNQLDCEEKINTPPMDWKLAIKIAENCNVSEVTILQEKFLDGFPNTYTYTKNLAETLISEYSDILPTVVVRPSIVVPSVSDPLPGWVDNLNGPGALCLAIASGSLRSMFLREEIVQQFVPVDVAIQGIIAVPWHLANRSEKLEVYNATCPDMALTYKSFFEGYSKIAMYRPLKNALWYPRIGTIFTDNPIAYKFNSIMFHLLPALIINQVMKTLNILVFNNLLRMQTSIHLAVMALVRFNFWSFNFSYDNFLELEKSIVPEDRDDFPFNHRRLDPSQYMADSIYICGMVIFKNMFTEEDYEKARVKYRRFYVLDRLTKWIFKSLLLFLAFKLAMTCYS